MRFQELINKDNFETKNVNEFIDYIWNEAVGDLKNLFEVDLNRFNITLEEVIF
jgi:hypothetical protein